MLQYFSNGPYRITGTYAAGYSTDYFPGIEGLVLLSAAFVFDLIGVGVSTHNGP